MAVVSEELAGLLKLRWLLNEAIKSQRRSDKCCANYIEKTNTSGFSRSLTTSFNANASHNVSALKSDLKGLKNELITFFGVEPTKLKKSEYAV